MESDDRLGLDNETLSRSRSVNVDESPETDERPDRRETRTLCARGQEDTGESKSRRHCQRDTGDQIIWRQTGSTETRDHETHSPTPLEGSLRRAAPSKFHLAHTEQSHKAL